MVTIKTFLLLLKTRLGTAVMAMVTAIWSGLKGLMDLVDGLGFLGVDIGLASLLLLACPLVAVPILRFAERRRWRAGLRERLIEARRTLLDEPQLELEGRSLWWAPPWHRGTWYVRLDADGFELSCPIHELSGEWNRVVAGERTGLGKWRLQLGLETIRLQVPRDSGFDRSQRARVDDFIAVQLDDIKEMWEGVGEKKLEAARANGDAARSTKPPQGP